MKQIGNKDYVFKGWDWCECAEYFAFSTELSEEDSEHIIKKSLDAISNDIGNSDIISCHPDVVKLKEFVRMITLGDHGYAVPLWKGLYKIEHDGVFITYFRILYKHLWT